MADYGLIIKNQYNEIQIDSIYKNFALKQTNSSSIVVGVNTIDITDVSSPPIFVSKVDSTYYHNLYGLIESGADFTNAYIFAEGSMTLYWKTFIAESVAALPTYGLIVRNPSNEIVFNSNDTWIKIISVNTQSVAYGATADITVIDADNNYFYLTDWSWDLRSFELTPPFWHFDYSTRGIKKINSTTVRIGTFIWVGGTVGGEITDNAWYNTCTLIEFEA